MKRNNNKRLVINALLLGIGAMLHQITPTLGLPMQPDFALVIMITIMILNEGEYKTSLIVGIITGIITALTTKFPGGQVPNIIDKIVTVNIIYAVIVFLNKVYASKVNDEKAKVIIVSCILALGTLISGIIFLVAALIIVGLPVSFTILFLTIVLPTILINSIVGVTLYKAIIFSLKKIIVF